MNIEPEQLRAKFKHAIDFGIEGPYNRHRAGEFEVAVRAHVAASRTRAIAGRFRGSQLVVLHVDPETGLVVMTDRENVFVSAWKLSARQLRNVLERAML